MIEAGNIEGAVTALGGTSTSNIVDLIKSKKRNDINTLEERIKKYSKVYNSKINGLIEALKRSKLSYLINLFAKFSFDFIKSPKKTILKTKKETS